MSAHSHAAKPYCIDLLWLRRIFESLTEGYSLQEIADEIQNFLFYYIDGVVLKSASLKPNKSGKSFRIDFETKDDKGGKYKYCLWCDNKGDL